MPPSITPSDVQKIVKAFDLGPVTIRQHTDKVFCLQAPNGAFALRFYNAGVSQTHVQAVQTACQLLVETELPVSKALATSTGTTVVEYNGWFGELQPWIVHNEDGGDWNTLIIAANVLRQMHAHLAAIQVQPDQQEDPWRTPLALAEQLTRDKENLRQQGQVAGVDISGHLDQAMRILDILQKDGHLDDYPLQLTHGDFQGPNLLFQDTTLAGIIDFERLEYRPRLYDLAWPFVFWRWFGTDIGAYAETDWNYVRACCQAYDSATSAKIDDDEWRTLPLLMAYIPVRGIALAAQEAAPVAEIMAFAQALDFAEWLGQNHDQAVCRFGVL